MKHRIRSALIQMARRIFALRMRPEAIVEVKPEDRWQDDGGATAATGLPEIPDQTAQNVPFEMKFKQS